jgi:hypothetical protein
MRARCVTTDQSPDNPLKTIYFFKKYFERAADERIFIAEISAVSQDFLITQLGV